MKECLHCHKSKSESEFYALTGTTDGKNGYCIECFDKICAGDLAALTSSFVYAISGGGLVKIGVANNPENRLKAHQIGSPIILKLEAAKYVPEAYKFERMLHGVYKAHRKHGEWFDFEPIRENLLELLE